MNGSFSGIECNNFGKMNKSNKQPENQLQSTALNSFFKKFIGKQSYKNLISILDEYLQQLKEDGIRANKHAVFSAIKTFNHFYFVIKNDLFVHQKNVYLKKLSQVIIYFCELSLSESYKQKPTNSEKYDPIRNEAQRIIDMLILFLENDSEQIDHVLLKLRNVSGFGKHVLNMVLKYFLDVNETMGKLKDVEYTRKVLLFRVWQKTEEKREKKKLITQKAVKVLIAPPKFLNNRRLFEILQPIPSSVTNFLLKKNNNTLDDSIKEYFAYIEPTTLAVSDIEEISDDESTEAKPSGESSSRNNRNKQKVKKKKKTRKKQKMVGEVVVLDSDEEDQVKEVDPPTLRNEVIEISDDDSDNSQNSIDTKQSNSQSVQDFVQNDKSEDLVSLNKMSLGTASSDSLDSIVVPARAESSNKSISAVNDNLPKESHTSTNNFIPHFEEEEEEETEPENTNGFVESKETSEIVEVSKTLDNNLNQRKTKESKLKAVESRRESSESKNLEACEKAVSKLPDDIATVEPDPDTMETENSFAFMNEHEPFPNTYANINEEVQPDVIANEVEISTEYSFSTDENYVVEDQHIEKDSINDNHSETYADNIIEIGATVEVLPGEMVKDMADAISECDDIERNTNSSSIINIPTSNNGFDINGEEDNASQELSNTVEMEKSLEKPKNDEVHGFKGALNQNGLWREICDKKSDYRFSSDYAPILSKDQFENSIPQIIGVEKPETINNNHANKNLNSKVANNCSRKTPPCLNSQSSPKHSKKNDTTEPTRTFSDEMLCSIPKEKVKTLIESFGIPIFTTNVRKSLNQMKLQTESGKKPKIKYKKSPNKRRKALAGFVDEGAVYTDSSFISENEDSDSCNSSDSDSPDHETMTEADKAEYLENLKATRNTFLEKNNRVKKKTVSDKKLDSAEKQVPIVKKPNSPHAATKQKSDLPEKVSQRKSKFDDERTEELSAHQNTAENFDSSKTHRKSTHQRHRKEEDTNSSANHSYSEVTTNKRHSSPSPIIGSKTKEPWVLSPAARKNCKKDAEANPTPESRTKFTDSEHSETKKNAEVFTNRKHSFRNDDSDKSSSYQNPAENFNLLRSHRKSSNQKHRKEEDDSTSFTKLSCNEAPPPKYTNGPSTSAIKSAPDKESSRMKRKKEHDQPEPTRPRVKFADLEYNEWFKRSKLEMILPKPVRSRYPPQPLGQEHQKKSVRFQTECNKVRDYDKHESPVLGQVPALILQRMTEEDIQKYKDEVRSKRSLDDSLSKSEAKAAKKRSKHRKEPSPPPKLPLDVNEVQNGQHRRQKSEIIQSILKKPFRTENRANREPNRPKRCISEIMTFNKSGVVEEIDVPSFYNLGFYVENSSSDSKSQKHNSKHYIAVKKSVEDVNSEKDQNFKPSECFSEFSTSPDPEDQNLPDIDQVMQCLREDDDLIPIYQNPSKSNTPKSQSWHIPTPQNSQDSAPSNNNLDYLNCLEDSSLLLNPENDKDNRLPFKKRRRSVMDTKLEIEEETLKPKKADISYPATPMISIAELEGAPSTEKFRPFKTPAELKEMPPISTPPVLYNLNTADPSPIITDQFNINNHTYNNPTINYHMNSIPFINFACEALYTPMQGIFVPSFSNMHPNNCYTTNKSTGSTKTTKETTGMHHPQATPRCHQNK